MFYFVCWFCYCNNLVGCSTLKKASLNKKAFFVVVVVFSYAANEPLAQILIQSFKSSEWMEQWHCNTITHSVQFLYVAKNYGIMKFRVVRDRLWSSLLIYCYAILNGMCFCLKMHEYNRKCIHYICKNVKNLPISELNLCFCAYKMPSTSLLCYHDNL